MMKKILPLSIIALALAATPAAAAGIKYFEDPVYQKLAPDDHLPMEDMMMLADQGDVRAMYIMGDLYSKGKGGFAKNLPKAREWFEASARNGYAFSFIRLAAIAKHAGQPVDAYQWYSLAATHCEGPDRKWAEEARDRVVADAKLTEAQMDAAKKSAHDWQVEAVEKNRVDREERQKKADAFIGPKIPDPDAPQQAPLKPQRPEYQQQKYRNGDN